MPFSPTRKFKLEALNRDERYLTLPRPERLFVTSLLMYVDCKGREVANSRTLRETLYEFDADVEPVTVDLMLSVLEDRGWLLQYIVGQRILMQLNPVALSEFVSMDGRDESRFPPPEPGPEATLRAMWGDSGPTVAEGKGEGQERGEVPRWMLDPELPPPQGCTRHPNNTGLIACGPCAGASKIHRQFMDGSLDHAGAVEAWGGIPDE